LENLGFTQVYFFSDNSPPIIPDHGKEIVSQPTYGNLRNFLNKRFKKPFLKTGDNLWFFFAGHGVRHENKDYLMPMDANPEDVEHTAIPLSFVTEKLRAAGADNVVLLIDACRSEGKRTGIGIGKDKQRGVVTLFSCSPDQSSYEIDELKQGSFSYALLQSLSIQGEGNCATVERLYQHLRHYVPLLNRQYGKPEQTPYAVVEPATKYHLILLPKFSTLKDAETLKSDARNAEIQKDFVLAKQLWVRVLAVSPADPDAIAAIERLSSHSIFPPVQPGRGGGSRGTDHSKQWTGKILVASVSALLLGFVGWRIWSIESDIPPSSDIRLSNGSELIFDQEAPTAHKQSGIAVLSGENPNYDAAIRNFLLSLKEENDDLESLIYLNNAVAGKFKNSSLVITLVAAAPISANSDISKEMLRGIAQAQSEFNCGVDEVSEAIDSVEEDSHSLNCAGNSQYVEILLVSDTATSEIDDPQNLDYARRVAEKIASDKSLGLEGAGVVGVLGHFNTDICQTAGEIYDQNKLVSISAICTGKNLTELDYFFRTTPDDLDAGKELAEHFVKELDQDVANVAVAYVPDNGYSESLRESFLTQLNSLAPNRNSGDDVDCIIEDELNAESCFEKIISKEAQALLMVPNSEANLTYAHTKLTKYLDENEEIDMPLLGGDAVYNNNKTIDDFGAESAGTGLVIFVAWHRENNEDNISAFEEDARTLYGTSSVNWRSAMSYDSTQAFLSVIQGFSGNDEINRIRNSMRGKLRSSSFSAPGVAGPNSVKFGESGNRNIDDFENEIGVLVEVRCEDDGKCDFFKID
jgi:ABC-type branched-subunit amino acid transport system substrate-binding protein